MLHWLLRIFCFLGFHEKEQHTKRIFLVRGRKRPTPSYAGIPRDAQINSVVHLSYITDYYLDQFECPRCKKERTSHGADYAVVSYNQMIYLKEGKCYLARPVLLEESV